MFFFLAVRYFIYKLTQNCDAQGITAWELEAVTWEKNMQFL